MLARPKMQASKAVILLVALLAVSEKSANASGLSSLLGLNSTGSASWGAGGFSMGGSVLNATGHGILFNHTALLAFLTKPPPPSAAPVPPVTPTPPSPRAPSPRSPSPSPAPSSGFASIAEAAAATPELSTLVAAATAVGLADALTNPNLVATLLAPNNAAFTALLQRLGVTPDALLANQDLVTTVLSYHLVPGVAARAADLTNGQSLPTADQGQNLTVIKSGSSVSFKPSAAGAPNAKVVQADIAAGKAIIHSIDTVLIPANAQIPGGAPPSPAAANATAARAPPRAATTTDTTGTGAVGTGVAAPRVGGTEQQVTARNIGGETNLVGAEAAGGAAGVETTRGGQEVTTVSRG